MGGGRTCEARAERWATAACQARLGWGVPSPGPVGPMAALLPNRRLRFRYSTATMPMAPPHPPTPHPPLAPPAPRHPFPTRAPGRAPAAPWPGMHPSPWHGRATPVKLTGQNQLVKSNWPSADTRRDRPIPRRAEREEAGGAGRGGGMSCRALGSRIVRRAAPQGLQPGVEATLVRRATAARGRGRGAGLALGACPGQRGTRPLRCAAGLRWGVARRRFAAARVWRRGQAAPHASRRASPRPRSARIWGVC
jgi:hypothetical protein